MEPGENLTVAEKRDILDGVISDLRRGFPGDLALSGVPGERERFRRIPEFS